MGARNEHASRMTARLTRISVCLVILALLMMALPLPKDDAMSESRHAVVHPHEPLVSLFRKASARRPRPKRRAASAKRRLSRGCHLSSTGDRVGQGERKGLRFTCAS